MTENLEQLKIRVNEFKKSYELAKQKREQLVATIEELDKKIEDLEKQLEERTENKKNLIKSIKKASLAIALMISIFTIKNIIFKDFSMYLFQIIWLLIINITFFVVPAIPKNKKTTNSSKKQRISLKKLQKEYQDTLELRISEGQKYKGIKDEEDLTYKIYKATSELLSQEKESVEDTEITDTYQSTPLDMKDIYYKIRVDYSFYDESIESQREILDKKLREYLINKIIEIYDNKLEIADLESLTIKELIIMLMNQIPDNEYSKNLVHVIHAIINFAGTMQSYSVVWKEEKDNELIKNPKVIFDEEGKWLELITHNNTPYEIIFDITYNTFLNEFMKNNKHKSRKRNKQEEI